MAGQMTLLDSIRPFFGNAEGADDFFRSVYFTGQYDQPANDEASPDSILDTPGEFAMLVKYYEDSTKPAGADGNDVHPDFTNFLNFKNSSKYLLKYSKVFPLGNSLLRLIVVPEK